MDNRNLPNRSPKPGTKIRPSNNTIRRKSERWVYNGCSTSFCRAIPMNTLERLYSLYLASFGYLRFGCFAGSLNKARIPDSVDLAA
jgi:hypothetical protein